MSVDEEFDGPYALPRLYVHLLPRLIPEGCLAGGVAIIVDILRASTVIAQALASGCAEVVPCVEVDEARAEGARRPLGSAFLGGERNGLPIEGFDLGNSPSSYTPQVCAGQTLVFTTTNGTRAIHAALSASRVLVAAFVNLSATAENVLREGRTAHIVCAGTDGAVSWEDTLFAGALAARLTLSAPSPYTPANDAAQVALALWLSYSEQHENLEDLLASGLGGRRVRRLGLGQDIHDAARIDCHDLVAVVTRDPLRILATEKGARFPDIMDTIR